MVIESIIEQLQNSNHIDINQDYSDWEMIGKWVEENEAGWHFPSLSWQYIEGLIISHLEKTNREELLSLMKDVFEKGNITDRYFDIGIKDADDINFVNFELLTEYIKTHLVNDAARAGVTVTR